MKGICSKRRIVKMKSLKIQEILKHKLENAQVLSLPGSPVIQRFSQKNSKGKRLIFGVSDFEIKSMDLYAKERWLSKF